MTFEERRQAALKYVKGLQVLRVYPTRNVEHYRFLSFRDYRIREFFRGGWA